VRDLSQHAVGNTRDNEGAITVADEHHVAQTLVLKDVEHVLDEGLKVDPGVETSWPAERRSGTPRDQDQPPCMEP